MSEEVRGLVVAHSTLAAGLVAAARQITGLPEEALAAVSNDGLGPDALGQAVRDALGEGPAVVFTDLGSGSCAFAGRRICLDRPDTALMSGVNLPMLLDFAFHRELPLAQLVDRLVDRARGGITGVFRETAANADRAAAR
jgi:mannose/fructose-specific phosphotransferase system component IIA